MNLRARAFLLFALALFLPQCGGGTGGTGVRSLDGVVFDQQSGLPLDGVTVTVVESGNSAVTAGGGIFTLDAAADQSDITLLFEEGTQLSATAVVSSLAPGTQPVQVSVQVNRANNQATITGVVVPTAIPTPTSPPAPVIPTATATPLAINTATPTTAPTDAAESPTSTPTPTATPFVATACDADVDHSGMVNINDTVAANNMYAAGNFDFNHDGATTPADSQEFYAAFQMFQGQNCKN